MSWFEDVLSYASSIADIGSSVATAVNSGGTSSSNSSTAVATGGSANVQVNPTILNSLDLGPLAAPLQKFVDAITVGNVAQLATAAAIDRGAEALAAAQAGRNASLDRIAQLASLGGLAFAVMRLFKK